MEPLRNNEEFEICIHFNDFSTQGTTYNDYIVRTDGRIHHWDGDERDEIITSKHVGILDLDYNDGNRSDNPLGVINSSYGYINIWDAEDTLNPLNLSSPYYSIMRPGVKITIDLIGNPGNDNEYQTPYFAGYISKWNTSFSEGINGYAALSIEDKLNMIGLTDLTDVEYSGTNAADAFNTIFTAAGLNPSTDFIIDESIDLQSYEYDTLLDGIARNTLNDLCRRTLSYLTIKHDGNVYLEPLMTDSSASVDAVVNAEYIGAISLKNTNAVNYTEVKVSYPLDKDYDYIGDLTIGAISANSSAAKSFTFPKTVYSVEDVALTVNPVESGNELVDDDISFTYISKSSSGRKKLKITVTNGHNFSINAQAKIYGLVPGGDQIHVTDAYSLPGSSLVTKETFMYDSAMPLDDADAETLRNAIGNYIVSLRRVISINNSMLTPELEVGDIIRIAGLNSIYNGKYRVSTMHITAGDSYNVSVSLLKI